MHLRRGYVTLRIVSADIAAILREAEKENIILFSVIPVDELTVTLQVRRQEEHHLRTLLQKRGAKIDILRKNGIYWLMRGFLKRPVMVCAVVAILLAGFYLPTRIYFFEVEGNLDVPTKLILQAAEEAGIHFGASARAVRSEKMKNTLLEKIPQLQWAGINTNGCVATISVKERKMNEQSQKAPNVSSIVATQDGMICDMTVTSGNPVCKIGQAVSEGQILISGYIDCDRSIRATRSCGEVYATTMRKIEAVLPTNFAFRGAQADKLEKISVILGKKRINFYSGSGILDSSCVKMYEEKYVTLPGGFQLPIAIVTETWITCQERSEELTLEHGAQTLSQLSRRYLNEQMIAGTVLSQKEEVSVSEGFICLTGEYGCIEMIGREQNEEIIKP